MQFQADVLGAPVIVPEVSETTALGAAYLAGLGAGLWRSLDAVTARHAVERTFRPSAAAAARSEGYAGWRRAVERARGWTA